MLMFRYSLLIQIVFLVNILQFIRLRCAVQAGFSIRQRGGAVSARGRPEQPVGRRHRGRVWAGIPPLPRRSVSLHCRGKL